MLAVAVPLPSDPSALPSASVPLLYRVTWTGRRDHALAESLKKLYSSGSTPTLDIDVQTAQLDEADWEALEAFVSDVLDLVPGDGPKPSIILCACNIFLIRLCTGPLTQGRNYL